MFDLGTDMVHNWLAKTSVSEGDTGIKRNARNVSLFSKSRWRETAREK